ncbi:MAG: helix-turn-helix domain-containing protein [Polyangiales bacterium]|jgi:DNA-binding transcriptional regulator YiaG
MTDDLEIRELTERDFKHMIRGSTRRRIMQGRIESGKDIAALRRFTKLSQKEFARALEISVHTLRNWEQGRRQPEGPAIALLKIAARHPNIIRRAVARTSSATKATSR